MTSIIRTIPAPAFLATRPGALVTEYADGRCVCHPADYAAALIEEEDVREDAALRHLTLDEIERLDMTSTTPIYGHVLDYQTADVIRPATRADWLYAREHGQPHIGVYADPETGDSVYCDGPDEDPAPALAE